MTNTVRYFGRLRETFGVDTEIIAHGASAATLGALLTVLRTRHGERADALLSPRIRVSIDGEILGFEPAMALRDGCEVAFLPPVTGG